MRACSVSIVVVVAVSLACGGGSSALVAMPEPVAMTPVGAIERAGTLCEEPEVVWLACDLQGSGALAVCSQGELSSAGGAVIVRLHREGQPQIALTNGDTYFHEVFELTDQVDWSGPSGPPPLHRAGLAYVGGDEGLAVQLTDTSPAITTIDVVMYSVDNPRQTMTCLPGARGNLQGLVDRLGAVERL